MIPEHQDYINQLPGKLTEIKDILGRAYLLLPPEGDIPVRDLIFEARDRVLRLFYRLPVMLLTSPPTSATPRPPGS